MTHSSKSPDSSSDLKPERTLSSSEMSLINFGLALYIFHICVIIAFMTVSQGSLFRVVAHNRQELGLEVLLAFAAWLAFRSQKPLFRNLAALAIVAEFLYFLFFAALWLSAGKLDFPFALMVLGLFVFCFATRGFQFSLYLEPGPGRILVWCISVFAPVLLFAFFQVGLN